VIVTRAALNRAEEEGRWEQRKALRAKLAAVRADKGKVYADYRRIAARIKQEREWRARMQVEIERTRKGRERGQESLYGTLNRF
jgi:hypothetical protein